MIRGPADGQDTRNLGSIQRQHPQTCSSLSSIKQPDDQPRAGHVAAQVSQINQASTHHHLQMQHQTNNPVLPNQNIQQNNNFCPNTNAHTKSHEKCQNISNENINTVIRQPLPGIAGVQNHELKPIQDQNLNYQNVQQQQNNSQIQQQNQLPQQTNSQQLNQNVNQLITNQPINQPNPQGIKQQQQINQTQNKQGIMVNLAGALGQKNQQVGSIIGQAKEGLFSSQNKQQQQGQQGQWHQQSGSSPFGGLGNLFTRQKVKPGIVVFSMIQKK